MDSHAWVERHRPSRLSDIAGQEHALRVITAMVEGGAQTLPHLLLYGPPGTGKTSTVLAMYKQVCKGKARRNHVLIVDASTDRGIVMVREQIGDFVKRRASSLKLVILDEADALSPVAQGALRRIVEEYASGTRFCFLCNRVSALSHAIQSRCMMFRFNPVKGPAMASRLAKIGEHEGMDTNLLAAAVPAIIEASDGDMRHGVAMLQRINSDTGEDGDKTIINRHCKRRPCLSPSTWRDGTLGTVSSLLRSGTPIIDILRSLVDSVAEDSVAEDSPRKTGGGMSTLLSNMMVLSEAVHDASRGTCPEVTLAFTLQQLM